METCGIKRLTADEYNRAQGFRSSMFGPLSRSPAHLRAYLDTPHEPTKDMQLGILVHSALEDFELWRNSVAISQKFDRRTKDGKLAAEAFAIENEGKTILDQETFEQVSRMVESLMSHETASRLLTGGHAEMSFFWQDPKTGLQCKCRPDFLRAGGLIVDLKTTYDASPRAFQRSIATYGYHRQAAFYRNGVRAVTGEAYEDFIIVAVEKEPPFATAVYALDSATMEAGEFEVDRLLSLYNRCEVEGTWPAYSAKIEAINLPAYAWPEIA